MPTSIAIDGPAGAGKSTVAKMLAKELGFVYVNTGLMYRAISYTVKKYNINLLDSQKIAKVPQLFDFHYNINNQKFEVRIEGHTFTPETTELYTPEIAKIVPIISQIPELRSFIKDIQRSVASKNDVVMEGRDIGTVILPNASFKYFITATTETRAKRRYNHLLREGINANYEEIYTTIKNRDILDITRKTSPLIPAADSRVISTDNLTPTEVTKMLADDVINTLQKGGIDKIAL